MTNIAIAKVVVWALIDLMWISHGNGLISTQFTSKVNKQLCCDIFTLSETVAAVNKGTTIL